MAELPFPASGGVLEAFLERVRFSPNAKIDISWLVECLGISQRPNAGRTLRWLQAAGIVASTGLLTDRGRNLLRVPSDESFRSAALESLEALAGAETLQNLRSRKSSKTRLEDEIFGDYGVGAATASKALVGLRVMADLSGDEELIRALGKAQFKKHQPVRADVSLSQTKDEILSAFRLFTSGTGGIDGWLSEETPDETFERLADMPMEPISAAQLNQLLTLAHAPPLNDGFFEYYWLTESTHTYNIRALPCYREDWNGSQAIFHIDQLYWGLYRFYVDALLYFGNIRAAYQVLRGMGHLELVSFFATRKYDNAAMIARGPGLPLRSIDRDDRYLISEMACKSFAPTEEEGVGLETALREAYREHQKKDSGPVKVGYLLGKESGTYVMLRYKDSQAMFEFAADEILDHEIASESELHEMLEPIRERFEMAREQAVANTKLYLSSVGEMDVYVATSMRTRKDFHSMVDLCEVIFDDRQLRRYDLRYFDPTLSAASNHEDKGLIECLMVSCAKILIYTAGEKESYGKDVEAAMALSQGKPVIFYCSLSERQKFYREVHPLSRLVDFKTGVVVGAMVTDSPEEVVVLLDRLFTNTMQYSLEQKRPGYLVLKEQVTDCVVRLQTNDDLLRETFWNHYLVAREAVMTAKEHGAQHVDDRRMP